MGTLIFLCVIAFLIQIASVAMAIRRALGSRPVPGPSPVGQPPVTILRPICGLENNLRETLESAFLLEWPGGYEIVFCVASATDPAIPLAERLIDQYPHVSARLLVGDDRVSVNPKLNNLIKGWNAARHEWIVMADSNVLMPRDYLGRLFCRWTEGTGMVCSPPVGSAPEGFFAELECAWLNSYQARWQLVADEIGLGFAQGKTMLVNRRLIENAGGIERLADEVAEDAASTKIVRGAGLSVRLVEMPFPQPLGERTWSSIWRRQLRWARLRRVSFPLFFLPELLSGGALPVLGIVIAAAAGALSPLAAAGFVLAWYGAELLLILAYRWPLSPVTPLALVARDGVLPVLWLAAWFGNGFVWRGNRMAVEQHMPSGPSLRKVHALVERTKARARTFSAHWRSG